MYLKLLNAVNSTTTAPTAATDGVPLRGIGVPAAAGDGTLVGLRDAIDATALVIGTGGVTGPTVTIRLWAYSALSGQWHPITNPYLTSTDANRGLMNNGNAIGLISGDTVIRHEERVFFIGVFDRVAAQITAIAGATPPTVSLWLVSRFGK